LEGGGGGGAKGEVQGCRQRRRLVVKKQSSSAHSRAVVVVEAWVWVWVGGVLRRAARTTTEEVVGGCVRSRGEIGGGREDVSSLRPPPFPTDSTDLSSRSHSSPEVARTDTDSVHVRPAIGKQPTKGSGGGGWWLKTENHARSPPHGEIGNSGEARPTCGDDFLVMNAHVCAQTHSQAFMCARARNPFPDRFVRAGSHGVFGVFGVPESSGRSSARVVVGGDDRERPGVIG